MLCDSFCLMQEKLCSVRVGQIKMEEAKRSARRGSKAHISTFKLPYEAVFGLRSTTCRLGDAV